LVSQAEISRILFDKDAEELKKGAEAFESSSVYAYFIKEMEKGKLWSKLT
jgi:hypothetical protein